MPRTPRAVRGRAIPALVERAASTRRGPSARAAACRGRARRGASAAEPLARPTLADLGERGLRWGTLLVSALAGAALLGAAAWFARLVSAALVRDDWLGWTTLALLLVAALAARHAAAARARRLLAPGPPAPPQGRRRRRHRATATSKRERKAARRLADLYAGRPTLAWSVRRFREHARDVHDPGELLALADRDIVAPLDREARRAHHPLGQARRHRHGHVPRWC